MSNQKSNKKVDQKLIDLASKKYKEFDQNMSKTIRFFLQKDLTKSEISKILTEGTNKKVIYQWIRNVSLLEIKSK